MSPRIPLLRPVLSHQGGWDEALMIFGIPVVLFTLMRWLAGRKAKDPNEPE